MGSPLGKAFPYHMCVDCKFWPAMAGFGANPKFGCPLMSPFGAYQLLCTPRGLFSMPVDVLIEDGRVVNVMYGDTIGKHMDVSVVEEFAGVSGGVGAQVRRGEPRSEERGTRSERRQRGAKRRSDKKYW